MNEFDRIVAGALATWWELHPVDASFAGETAFDDRLTAADSGAQQRERSILRESIAGLDAVVVPDRPGARLDVRLLRSTFALALAELERRPRRDNPSWYTGEVAFGIIVHLLPDAVVRSASALAARLAAAPFLLDAGARHLRSRPLPAAWVQRARGEAAAIATLVTRGFACHPDAQRFAHMPVAPLLAALDRLCEAIEGAPDADVACGDDHLASIVSAVHGLDETPASLLARAQRAYDAALDALVERAARLDPKRNWRAQLASLAEIGPRPADDPIVAYTRWHERAMHDAASLVTPESSYTLTFAPLPAWAEPVARALYFLFYRAPAARYPGAGSTYWVSALHGDEAAVRRAHNTAAVKITHAVHHGSIGHHTQNARARAATSRVARIAGTDGAMGLAMLAAGTMVEGWACYSTDLLAEIPGFYTPLEELQLAYDKLRNIACCIADIRLHLRTWTLEEMRAFYRDEVGFAAARIVPETTRNAMFPGSRIMYWTGTERIAAMRRASALPARAFHDTLLSFGSAPLAWIEKEEAVWRSPVRS